MPWNMFCIYVLSIFLYKCQGGPPQLLYPRGGRKLKSVVQNQKILWTKRWEKYTPPPTYLLSEHKGDGDKHKLFKQLHLAFIYIHIHVGGPGLKSVFAS